MPASLKYNAEWYLPNNTLSGTISQRDIRSEYTRLRDIAQKRIKRLGESEWADTKLYKKYREGFPKLSQIPNETNLSYEMAALAKFVNMKTSTITGLRHQRTESLRTLKRHGYDFVNEQNYRAFGEFMEAYRDRIEEKKQVGSPIVVELYYNTVRLGLNPEDVKKDFEWWVNNINVVKDIEPIKGKTAGDARAIRKKINRRKRGRK